MNTHNRLRYFLTNKIFLSRVVYRYIHMILIVKCVTVTHFFYCLYSTLMEKHDFREIQCAKHRGKLYERTNWSILQDASSGRAAILKKQLSSWRDKHTVFTKDITLLHGDKYLIMRACVLLLLQVNDENVEHMSTAEVIDLLRKIRGTIGITVLRKSGTNIQVSWLLVDKN